MTDLDSSKPLFEASVKLCAAVKKHKCLHGPNSYHKYTPPECSEAWELVAEECNETVDFCKKRWKTLRRCFFQGLKRRGNNYYLHEHLKFLHEGKKKTKKNKVTNLNDETNSTISDTLQKSYDDNLSLQGSEMEATNYGDDDEVKSFSSQTTSADESNENIGEDSKMGVFIIDELEEEEANEGNKDNMDERRSNFKRSCKRSLDPNLIDELTEEEPEEKRSRKVVTEKRKTFKSENDSLTRDKPTIQSTKNQLRVRVDKLKINTAENKVESVQGKMVDRFTCTDLKLTRDFGTQYDLNSLQFDDSFMQTIRVQLHQMNARQKMNFKRKVYQSLLEVFDDATDFPNANEILPLPNKQAPRIVNTTVGELRLMRELVSLVQAAKNTPEIINAKDKVISSTPVQSKPPPKMPLPIVGTRPKGQALPPLSPAPDDDDLHFSVDNSDDEDDVSLPRSWNEIKTKPTEPAKPTTEDKVAGVPRRVLQKVVRVSGSNGSTIVTRDGDKKRVYRIYPKAINPNEDRTLPTKNNNSFGTFFVSPSKTSKDAKNDNNVGTLFASSSKNLQDTATSSNNKPNTSSSSSSNAPNTVMRSFIDKPKNGTNETVSSLNKTNQQTISNSINNNLNSQTIFKNVHPANRILSPTTGFFKIISTQKPIEKAISVQPTAAATNSNSTKLMITKLPVNPMMPPVSNVTAKRTHIVRPGTQITQRRYSICGALPAENTSSPNSAAAATSKSSTTIKSNGNSQAQSNSVSQIQISQPISLNSKAANAHTASNGQNIKTNSNVKTTDASTKDIKHVVYSYEKSGESVANKGPASSDTKAREIPILQTAGTVEADILDPLFVKPLIKSEPLDE